MSNSRIWIESVLYGSGAGRRFTQDSPVLPDVWVKYLEQPRKPLDLLIEPWLETPPSQVARALLRSFRNEGVGEEGSDKTVSVEDPSVAVPETESADALDESKDAEHGRTTYNRTMVVSQLTLRDLVHHVIPLTSWYRNAARYHKSPREVIYGYEGEPDTEADFTGRLPRPAPLWEVVFRSERG